MCRQRMLYSFCISSAAIAIIALVLLALGASPLPQPDGQGGDLATTPGVDASLLAQMSAQGKTGMEKAYYVMGKWMGVQEDVRMLSKSARDARDEARQARLDTAKNARAIVDLKQRLEDSQAREVGLRGELEDYVKTELMRAVMSIHDTHYRDEANKKATAVIKENFAEEGDQATQPDARPLGEAQAYGDVFKEGTSGAHAEGGVVEGGDAEAEGPATSTGDMGVEVEPTVGEMGDDVSTAMIATRVDTAVDGALDMESDA